jgi:aldose 1-epimerase
MTDVHLRDGGLSAVVSSTFGAIWSFEAERDGRTTPLLRPTSPGAANVATASGCFPLLPFGNRVRGNGFRYDGLNYVLEANTEWDRHYLHGEGWLADWRVEDASSRHVALAFDRGPAAGTPYVYGARQTVTLGEGRMTLGLSVTNRGASALPFGLGWHPFFPMTPATTLHAAASLYWGEDAQWLPTDLRTLPEELDFNAPRRPPRRWVNNGFEGWDGCAEIVWPERQASLAIAASGIFRRYFIFVSDTTFDPSYRQDFFCFEPMSHSAGAHHLADGGGLRRLEPGETLSGEVKLTPNLSRRSSR